MGRSETWTNVDSGSNVHIQRQELCWSSDLPHDLGWACLGFHRLIVLLGRFTSFEFSRTEQLSDHAIKFDTVLLPSNEGLIGWIWMISTLLKLRDPLKRYDDRSSSTFFLSFFLPFFFYFFLSFSLYFLIDFGRGIVLGCGSRKRHKPISISWSVGSIRLRTAIHLGSASNWIVRATRRESRTKISVRIWEGEESAPAPIARWSTPTCCKSGEWEMSSSRIPYELD